MKFKQTLSEPADFLFEKRLAFESALPGRSQAIDRLNAEHRVRAIRPLFRHGLTASVRSLYSGALLGVRTAETNRREVIRRRFARRASRAPPGVATPDLCHTYVLEVPEDADIEAIAARYRADPNVEYAHPDYVFTIHAEPLPSVLVMPNDPFLEDAANPGFWRERTWGQRYPDLWGLRNIQALEAWDLLPDPLGDPGQGVVVAVVDTGLDYTHPDIDLNVWINPCEDVNANGQADPSDVNGVDDVCAGELPNGYVDDIRGWDFANADNDPLDDNGHGTHVAGTIAATGNNGIGIVGVAPSSTILVAKGLNRFGFGLSSDLAKAILYAADNGADVINMSWGGTASAPVIVDAVAYAHSLGVVLVASAGNYAVNLALNTIEPATLPEVIAVSAFDNEDRIVWYSNRGHKIDVGAPGWDVLSLRAQGTSQGSDVEELVVEQDYIRFYGTSMAAPHVSGMAALVLANQPTLTSEEVRQVMRVSADDVDDPGFDKNSGHGRINARGALEVQTVLTARIDSPPDRLVMTPAVVPIVGTAAGPGFVNYEVLVGLMGEEGFASELTPLMAQPSTTPVTNGELVAWDSSAFPFGWYTIVLRARDDRSQVFESRRDVLIFDSGVPGWPVDDPLYASALLSVGDIGLAPGNEVIASSFHHVHAWSAGGELLFSIQIGDSLIRDYFPYGNHSLGDLDGDGDLEVVLASFSEEAGPPLDRPAIDGAMHVIDGDQLTTIVEGFDYFKPHPKGWRPIVVDDLDGDGIAEITWYDDQGSIAVRRGNGAMYSEDWPQQPVVPPPGGSIVGSPLATGDLDRDGTREILVALGANDPEDQLPLIEYPMTLYALRLDGTVKWSYTIPVDFDNDFYDRFLEAYVGQDDLLLGDLNADGRLEVLYAIFDRVSVRNMRYRYFVLSHEGELLTEWSVGERKLKFWTWGDHTLGDIDGDGDLEIVRDGRSRTFDPYRVYAWHHTGRLVDGFPVEMDEDAIAAPMIADVDGDGTGDIVSSLGICRNFRETNPIYAWDGNGQMLSAWPRFLFRTVLNQFLPAGDCFSASSPKYVTLADLDENGTLDLLASIGRYNVHAIDLGVPADAAGMDWPVFRHDVGRTGRHDFLAPGECLDSVEPGCACLKVSWTDPPIAFPRKPNQHPAKSRLVLNHLDDPTRTKIVARGFFNPATENPPIDPKQNGVRLRLESAGTVLLDVNVPGDTLAGADYSLGSELCGNRRDGWSVSAGRWRYRNRSGRFPPYCAADSAQGLREIRIEYSSSRHAYQYTVTTRNHPLAGSVETPPITEMTFELVLGAQATPGTPSPQELNGQCASQRFKNPAQSLPRPLCRRSPKTGTLKKVLCRGL